MATHLLPIVGSHVGIRKGQTANIRNLLSMLQMFPARLHFANLTRWALETPSQLSLRRGVMWGSVSAMIFGNFSNLLITWSWLRATNAGSFICQSDQELRFLVGPGRKGYGSSPLRAHRTIVAHPASHGFAYNWVALWIKNKTGTVRYMMDGRCVNHIDGFMTYAYRTLISIHPLTGIPWLDGQVP